MSTLFGSKTYKGAQKGAQSFEHEARALAELVVCAVVIVLIAMLIMAAGAVR